MATSSWNAGILRPVAVPPAGPLESGAAPGVWTLDQVTFWVKQGLWPSASNGPAPRGLFGGGSNSGGNSNVIAYVSLASTGNAKDFGDLSLQVFSLASCASSTRGLFAGGQQASSPFYMNTINYVTITTSGNSSSFGALTLGRAYVVGCSNDTRGLFAGGFDGGLVNTIDYVTIASTGNATDFGDLSTTTQNMGGCASTTRGVFAGGNVSAGRSSAIRYVTIASTGNSTVFVICQL